MSTLQFPTKYDDYFRLGLDSYQQQDYYKAIEYLMSAYKMKQNMEIHRFMIQCSIELEDYNEAKALFLEEKHKYLKSDEGVELYFSLLCETREWITARIILNKNPILQRQLDKLDYLEHTDAIYHKKELNKLSIKLKESLHSTVAYQIANFKQVVYLPLEQFVSLCDELLSNEHLNLLVRSDLLFTLIDLEYADTIQYLDIFEKSQDVIPVNLHDKLKHSEYQKFSYFILNHLDSKPTLREEMRILLPLIYNLLLPDIEQYMQNYQSLAYALIDELENQKKYHKNYDNDSQRLAQKIMKLLMTM